MGEAVFFLGIGIDRDRGSRTIKLSQKRYGRDVLSRFGMEECRTYQAPPFLPHSSSTRMMALKLSPSPPFNLLWVL